MRPKIKHRKPDPPQFATRDEEAEFWATHSSEDYHWEPVEVEIADPVMLSVRIDRTTMERLRAAAARQEETMSGIIRAWILERLVVDEAQRESDPVAMFTHELISKLSNTVLTMMSSPSLAEAGRDLPSFTIIVDPIKSPEHGKTDRFTTKP